MKKHHGFSAIIIITCILFSSCGSNMSIIKRHYNNGYYMAFSEYKQTSHTSKDEEKVVQTKTQEPLNSIQFKAERNIKNGDFGQNIMPNNNDVPAINAQMQGKVISPQSIRQTIKQKTTFIKNRVAQIKHVLNETKKIKKNSVEGEGLSLFWIVILVILVLWALGFAGGFLLGGLINLLLVIALIGLILWLFRVV